MTMRVSLIAAVAHNGVIGIEGRLPWRLPADMAWFRRLTVGHSVVMGRKTWESLPRPLVDRRNLVVSRNPAFLAPSGTVVPSVPEALGVARAAGESEAFVIGGERIYAEALPLADRIYLTRVHGDVAGDAFFPPLPQAWVERTREEHAADERHAFAFSMCVLERAE